MAIDIQGMTEVPAQMISKITNISNPTKEIKKQIGSKQEEKNKIFRYIGMEVYDDVKSDLERSDFSRYPKLEIHLRKLCELDEEIENNRKELAKLENADGIVCSCGNIMPKGSVFCSQCGKKLEKPQKKADTLICTCGKEVKREMKFCSFCGRDLSELKKENDSDETEVGEIEYKECICGAKYSAGETMCSNCGRLVGGNV